MVPICVYLDRIQLWRLTKKALTLLHNVQAISENLVQNLFKKVAHKFQNDK